MSDPLLLLCGAVLLYGPGTALLVACRVRRPQVLLGMAPAVGIGLFQLIALVRWALGTGLGKTTLAGIAVVVAVAVVLEWRAGRQAVSLTMARQGWAAVQAAPARAGLSVILLAVGCVIGLGSWLRGFHGLATPPQEHDTVQHTLITAYIAYTGHAGPFELMPADLATGHDIVFYPAGAHTFAGLLSMLSGNPVSGLNATTALILGLAAPLTLFATSTMFEVGRSRPVFSALAAVLAATLYRPYFELSHDAGILAFAMGLALAPGAVVGVAALRRSGVGAAAAVGVAALGLYAVHPSIAVIIVAVVAVVAIVASICSPAFREWTRDRAAVLATTAGVTVVLTSPWVVASLSAAGSVSSYPEAPPVAPLGDVVGQVAVFNYGGFIESGHPLYQVGFALLFWVGFVGCLTARRLWPLAAAWLFWAAAAILFASGHAALPGLRQLGSVLYNSWTRIDSVVWLIAPLVAGLGLAQLVTRVTDQERVHRSRWRNAVLPATAAVVAVGFLATSGIQYARINARAVAARYGQPEFYRLSSIEPQAFAYLAAHRAQVGRVLNNGNDGSTFLYVYDEIPVVNTYPLGMSQAEYGIYLMEHFNEIGTNPVVRCLVQRYHITHVITSVSSPRLPNFDAPGHWVKTPTFDYAPGFAGLARVPQVHEVFANADTKVYRIAPDILAGHDQGACTADPAHPLPSGAAAGSR